MTIFWDETGPVVVYRAGVLRIEDLNPEAKISWRMSRFEMFTLAWRCLLAALRP